MSRVPRPLRAMDTLADSSPDRVILALLHRAQDGDPDAQEKLLATLHVPIRDYVAGRTRRLPDGEDLADDVAQEALIRIVTRLHMCRATTGRQVLAWALATARTRLIDYLRRSDLPTDRLDDDTADPASSRGESPGSDFAAVGDFLQQIVDELPGETRALLELRVQGGESWPEIARALRTTAAGAKRRFQRLQVRLRREIEIRSDCLPARQRDAVQARLRRLR